MQIPVRTIIMFATCKLCGKVNNEHTAEQLLKCQWKLEEKGE